MTCDCPITSTSASPPLAGAASPATNPLLAEAASPATSPERLRELAAVHGLRVVVARNPATPPDVLDRWKDFWRVTPELPGPGPGESWASIHEAVAANPNASWEALVSLARYYPRTVYENGAFGVFLLCGETLDRIPGCALVPLLALRDIPEDWLRAGAEHPSHLARSFVAGDARTPPEVLVRLLDRSRLGHLVMRNPSLPQASIDQLVTDPELWRRVLVAGCARTRPAHLDQLALDPDPEVRAAVAGQPRLDEHTLWRLGHDAELRVRLAVARNSHASAGLLQKLWREGGAGLQGSVEHNPRLLEVALRMVDPARKKRADGRAPGKSYQERLREAARPGRARVAVARSKTPPEILDQLARSKETRLRREVARHPATWPSTLETLTADRKPEVRQAVARHPSTPRRSLETLARDAVRAVRCALLDNPSLPPLLRSTLGLDDSPEVRRRARLPVR